MIHSHSRRRWRFEWAYAASAFCAALACAAQPSRGANEPATPPRAAEAGAQASTGSPSSSESSARNETVESSQALESADGVVTLIAKPGLWPLDVESARHILQALGPVAREQATPKDLSLVGGSFGALDRFAVAYSLDEQSYWVFGSAGFFLGGADLARLYRSVEGRLTQLLGKPKWTDDSSDPELPTRAWDL